MLTTKKRVAAIAASVLIAAGCGSSSSSTDDAATEESGEVDDSTTSGSTANDAGDDTTADSGGDDTSGENGGDGEAMGDVISEECPIPNPDSEFEIDAIGWEFPIVTQYGDELKDCQEGNYKFNLQYLDSTEARNAMTQDAATGKPSYEMYQGSNSFINELAQQDFLIPLNDLIDKYRDQFKLDEIDPLFWEQMTLDGNIYALPMVSNTMHLFYNEPKLTEIGAEVPTTYDEALATCKQVKDAGNDVGFIFMLSAGWSWQIEFDSVLGAMGEKPIDPETGAPNFNTPTGVEAANLLKQFNDECGGSASGTYSTDDIQAGFQTGELIIGHTWASRAGAMDDPEASTVVGEIQYAPALSAGSATLGAPAYTDGWGIPVGTSEDKVETIFLAMLAATDTESQTAAAKYGTVTRAGVTNPEGPRDVEAAETSFLDGVGPDQVHPAAGIARAKLGDSLVKMLDGMSAEEALAEAEAEYLKEAQAQGLIE